MYLFWNSNSAIQCYPTYSIQLTFSLCVLIEGLPWCAEHLVKWDRTSLRVDGCTAAGIYFNGFVWFCCMRVPAATRTNQCCLGRRHFKEMALQTRSCWNLSTANLQGSLFLISGVDQQAQFLIWHFCAGMALGTWDRMSLSVTLLETKTATSRCRKTSKGLPLIHGLRTPMQRQRSGSGEMKSWESQVRTRTCIRLMRIDVSFLKLQLSYPMLSNLLYPTYILPLCSDRRTPMMRRASGEMRSYKS